MFKKLTFPLRVLGGGFLVFSGVLICAAGLQSAELETTLGPRWEIVLIGIEFLLAGAYTLWMKGWPRLPGLILAVAFWVGLAVLINWSAFGPGEHVLTRNNPSAGSFGTLALVWDILIVWFLFKTIRGYF